MAFDWQGFGTARRAGNPQRGEHRVRVQCYCRGLDWREESQDSQVPGGHENKEAEGTERSCEDRKPLRDKRCSDDGKGLFQGT